jgi:hypothetical protein
LAQLITFDSSRLGSNLSGKADENVFGASKAWAAQGSMRRLTGLAPRPTMGVGKPESAA